MWCSLVLRWLRRSEKRTSFVNTTVVQGWENRVLKNEAVVLHIYDDDDDDDNLETSSASAWTGAMYISPTLSPHQL